MSFPNDVLLEPSWQCVHFSAEEPDSAELRSLGVQIRHLDVTMVSSKRELMAELAHVLGLPESFGANWDALDDSLRDLPWLDHGSLVLITEGAAELWREAPELAAGLLSVWLGAAERWAERGVGLHLVYVW